MDNSIEELSMNIPTIEPNYTSYNGGYDKPVSGIRKSKSVAIEVISNSLSTIINVLSNDQNLNSEIVGGKNARN